LAVSERLVIEGEEVVGWMFELGLAAYNLVRMRKLIPDLA
jgi:hypothetical protein